MTQPVWNTPAGELGTYPASVPMSSQLSASATPVSSLQYTLQSGALPIGLSLSPEGLITGIPDILAAASPAYFTVRVRDNKNEIRDRTFSIKVSGTLAPKFLTPSGNLFPSSIQDSTWVDFPILYDNPYPNNPILLRMTSGGLPVGLEINELGEIRGYPVPPVISFSESPITVYAVSTNAATDAITLSGSYSTNGFAVGRPIKFSGESVFGNMLYNATYYIKSVIDHLSFTISESQNGPIFPLATATGNMTVDLPVVSVDTPTTRTYTFTLALTSSSGTATSTFKITVRNQNLPFSEGGSGSLGKVRLPTILNSRPRTYDTSSDTYDGYYRPTGNLSPIYIGVIKSGEYFSFKIIGHDFEGSPLEYNYLGGLPLGLDGNTETGWITGIPVIAMGVTGYSFNVSVDKTQDNVKVSEVFTFIFTISNTILNDVIWLTPDDLGTILNGSISTLNVSASAAVPLVYALISGSLPPNLVMMPDGEIIGNVAFQPGIHVLPQGQVSTYQFTVEARSAEYAIVASEKVFTLHVLQEYRQPTENVYIKATPSLADRNSIASLLTDDILIPYDMLYRPDDDNFGKATSVKYGHLYGILASRVTTYIDAISTHHYWRNVTLGSLRTAVARNSSGEIVYEVVYSEVVDEMKIIEPQESPLFADVSKDYVYWPVPVNGQRMFYPNSLKNMRDKVATTLGQSPDVRLLPLWMSSQQRSGSTLGYTAAWVICYSKPGYSETIKNNILVSLTSDITQTTAGTNILRGKTSSFYVDMPVTFSSTLGGIASGTVYYIKEVISTNSFTLSSTSGGSVVTLTNWTGTGMTLTKTAWAGALNEINFALDRFTVDKSQTFNYGANPPAWASLPSGTPKPDPKDSKDFHVLFPRKTILPN